MFLKPKFDEKINIKSKEFLIEVIYEKRRSSRASIKDNKIIFKFPKLLTKGQIENNYKILLGRIIKKIEKSNVVFLEDKLEKVFQNKYFNFNGEKYFIEFFNLKQTKLIQNTFYLNKNLDRKFLIKSISYFLEKKHLNFIKEYVSQINKKTYNYKIKDVRLKYIESKWGYCTKDNIIMINLKLLNSKKEFLDYVIIHELSHIKHKNHSKDFWDNVKIYFKNYKEIHKNLKLSPPDIL